ncbi:MAG: zinc-ribbon domain-containing protein [Candidatus Hermodarchaeota archaeon]
MPLCQNCGSQYPEESIYCPHCGTKVIVEPPSRGYFCSTCGYPNLPGASFCTNCGRPLAKFRKQSSPSHVLPPKTVFREYEYPPKLSVGNILYEGYNILQRHPKIFLIAIFAGIIDILIQFALLSYLYGVNLYSNPSEYLYYSYSPFPLIFLIIVITLISYLVSSFFTSWVLTSFKQIRRQREGVPLDLGISFNEGLRFLPSIIGATILVAIITLGVNFAGILGTIFISMLMLGPFYNNPDYPYYSSYAYQSLIFLIPALIGFLVVNIALQMLFTYVSQSIVLDERGAGASLSRSWRFAKKYFWITLGVSIVIFLISMGLSLFFGFMPFISAIVARGVQTTSIVCFAWAYDEGKHTIDEPRMQRYYRPY